jgi:hypothetical protein
MFLIQVLLKYIKRLYRKISVASTALVVFLRVVAFINGICFHIENFLQ